MWARLAARMLLPLATAVGRNHRAPEAHGAGQAQAQCCAVGSADAPRLVGVRVLVGGVAGCSMSTGMGMDQ
jgi:hypothetical protein